MKNEELKAIGSWSICNGCSLNVYDIEYGVEDRLLVKLSSEDKKPRWHKIYTNDKHSYINFGGSRWSLNECIRYN